MKNNAICKFFFFCFLLTFFSLFSQQEEMFLLENLNRVEVGDYLVVNVQKNLTLMHITKKTENRIVIEEVSIPARRFPSYMGWKEWMSKNGPGNNRWVFYEIDLQTGRMRNYYSVSKGGWFEIPDQDNLLTKLLNLPLHKIPFSERKKNGFKNPGAPDFRSVWQPRMIVDGQIIPRVNFDAWKGVWPKDNSDLSGKAIELYLPSEAELYSTYFPYWLEISGCVGKAKIRIIDSGKNLRSLKIAPF